MDKYGIKNIKYEFLDFNYDEYYREIAIKLKKLDSAGYDILRNTERQKLSDYLDVQINLEELKSNFINLLLDKDSSKLFWILYSKYDGEESFLDKLSDTLMKENKVIRGGINTYKMNGWMCHSLYVYQIANYNIAYNKELPNFKGRSDVKEQIQELNELYKELDNDLTFVLRMFSLIHDIGVIEHVLAHNETGVKFVDGVINELGITDDMLKEHGINISKKDLNQILKVLIENHVLVSLLSTEGSDNYVEDKYRELLNKLPDVCDIKKYNPIILFIFAYGDIIGVDEVLMNSDKYNRVKEGYLFFKSISQNRVPKRDKKKVAIERICDIVGNISYEKLEKEIEGLLKEKSIDYNSFLNNMFNLKYLSYAGPLMKALDDLKLSIRIFDKLFSLITVLDSAESIKDYSIIFIPYKTENEFVRLIKEGAFFECIDMMIDEKINELEFKNVKIHLDEINKEIHLGITIRR